MFHLSVQLVRLRDIKAHALPSRARAWHTLRVQRSLRGVVVWNMWQADESWSPFLSSLTSHFVYAPPTPPLSASLCIIHCQREPLSLQRAVVQLGDLWATLNCHSSLLLFRFLCFSERLIKDQRHVKKAVEEVFSSRIVIFWNRNVGFAVIYLLSKKYLQYDSFKEEWMSCKYVINIKWLLIIFNIQINTWTNTMLSSWFAANTGTDRKLHCSCCSKWWEVCYECYYILTDH